jgi:hypothetical protein
MALVPQFNVQDEGTRGELLMWAFGMTAALPKLCLGSGSAKLRQLQSGTWINRVRAVNAIGTPHYSTF